MSIKIYSNGDKMVRLVIDSHKMIFQLVDPVTGYIHTSGGEGITNIEVLQRKGKEAIMSFLNIKFNKEVRNVSRS